MTTLDLTTTPVRGLQAGYIPLSFQLKQAARRLIGVAGRGDPIPVEDRATATDIAFYEGNVDFDLMVLAGARACVAKCTQGTTIFDSKYTQNVNNCDAIPFGDYHYLINSNGTAQADWYTAHLLPAHLPFIHWVDVEVNGLKSSYIYQWAVRVKANLGMTDYSRIGLYTSAYMWSLVVDDGYKAWCSANLMLWVAHYGTLSPLLPTGWTKYVMHQYTSSGDGHAYGCESLEVDLNYTRRSWLENFSPSPTIEQRVATLESRVGELWQAVFPGGSMQ